MGHGFGEDLASRERRLASTSGSSRRADYPDARVPGYLASQYACTGVRGIYIVLVVFILQSHDALGGEHPPTEFFTLRRHLDLLMHQCPTHNAVSIAADNAECAP